MAMNLPSGSGHNRRGRGSRAPIAEINVTPFVDVMLVLLIIFMVTAPLLMAGVPVELPDSRAKALEQEKEPIQISIDKDGGVYLGEDAIDDNALVGQLSSLCAAETPPQVMLRGDRAIDYGRMMQIMGELNRAGCNSVSLVTTGSSESQ